MPDSKLIYKGYSLINFAISLLYRVGVVFVCMFASFNFNENPTGISIVLGIGLLFVLLIGDDEVIIYSDKILVPDNNLISLIFHTKPKEYKIKDIKNASIDDEEPDAEGEIIIKLISFLSPKMRYSSTHDILLELLNGETISISADLEYEKKKKIAGIINSLILEKIPL